MSTTKDIAGAIREASRGKTSPYDSSATVKRVEGSTVWVHIPGGVDETPVKMTVNCEPGDEVQIRVGKGGKAWIVGNVTAPPTDDKKANIALSETNDLRKDIYNVNELVADKASIGELEAMSIVVGGKAGLDDIGQRNLILNSKTMIFDEYGYDVDGGLTDENDTVLTDENQTVLTDGTPARMPITDVPEASSVDVSADSLFINQGDAIKQIPLSDVLTEGDKHFTYMQSLPSDRWVINHNLGKCPDVTVVDSAGSEVIGDCEYTSINSVTLTFSGAFGGTAYLN